MKKLLTLLTVLFITAPAYAQEKVEVTVKKERSLAEIIQAGQANAAAAATAKAAADTAAAAAAAAMSEPTTEIKTPLTVDFYNYTHIAIVDATYAVFNGRSGADKNTYADMVSRLGNSPLTVINPREYSKKKFKKNMRFLRDIKDSSWLYLYYTKSYQGVDEIRSLIIRDSKNKIIYNIKTKNVPQSEMITVFTEM